MKQLILIRHAKSSWETQNPDIKRPLAKRGVEDAFRVGEALKEKIKSHEYAVYSSPATRAFDTCCIITNALAFPTEKIIDDETLYDFEGINVKRFISRLPDSQNTVLIFGHNHAFTYLSNALGNQNLDNLPTCGAVCIKFNVPRWQKISTGETQWVLIPKKLRL